MKGTELYSIISLIGGLLLYQLVFIILRIWARRKQNRLPEVLNQYIYYPGALLTTAIAVSVGIVFLDNWFSPRIYAIIKQGLHITIIISAGFLIVRCFSVFSALTINHYQEDDVESYVLRKIKTQFQLIQRVFNIVIIVLTIGFALMTFKEVKQVGSTILASAGVIGIIFGFAAQKSIGTLFAGIQIAISQPIRIDDIVTVQGYFGVVAEITLTYVIIDVRDGRRITIPINYFLENSFENWTRVSPEVLAKISIKTTYNVPIDELRQKFKEFIDKTTLWDRRKWSFFVASSGDYSMELKGIASTRNTDDQSSLESDIKEKLITYLQQNYPEALLKGIPSAPVTQNKTT